MIPFDRSPTTFYRRSIVTMALSGVVSKVNGDFSRKLQNLYFATFVFCSLVFCAPAEGVPLGIGIGAGGHKTILMGLPGREGSLTISSAVWIQFTNVTDGQTDTGRQQRPRLRIASRGNQSTETKNTSQK